jgi:hypothetical protein
MVVDANTFIFNAQATPCGLTFWVVFWGFGVTIANLIYGGPDVLTAVACRSVDVWLLHIGEAARPQYLQFRPNLRFRIHSVGDRVNTAGFIL